MAPEIEVLSGAYNVGIDLETGRPAVVGRHGEQGNTSSFWRYSSSTSSEGSTPSLSATFFNGRKMRLVLVSLYAAKMVPGEPDELGELFLRHEALGALRPEGLADVHDSHCRHSPILSPLLTR